jgi:eukaryotic-like serine/threonine-protein kinase
LQFGLDGDTEGGASSPVSYRIEVRASGSPPQHRPLADRNLMPFVPEDVTIDIGGGIVPDLRAGDPRLIGSYRIVGRLGSGGMGTVFLGRSAAGRLVAVKVIRDELAEDPDFRVRFRREVAAARKVSGLFTAPVVDADLDAPVPFLVTAYIAGLPLADAVSRHGPLPAASVLSLAAGLAEGLGAIHSAGVVHRDLKPSNVLLAEDGPRVIDFGISRAAEATTVTRTGLVFGSPGFMSPEQAEGGQVGPASDVFSLGTVLAFAVTGEGPFGTGPTAALIYRVVHSPPNLDQVPIRIRPLIERCLAKDARQRPSPGDLLADLDGIGVWAGWLPAPVMQDLPQPAAWLTPAADAEGPPRGPDTEIAAVPGAARHPTGHSITQTASRQHPLVSADDAGQSPPGPPRAASASGPSTPAKIGRRRSRSLAMTAALVLLIIGFGAYYLVSTPDAKHTTSATSTTRPPPPSPAPSPKPSTAPPDLVIKIAARQQDCWVLLTQTSDGSQIYMGTLQPGTSMTFTEPEAVEIRLGNPAHTILTVNGKRQPINTNLPVTLSFSPAVSPQSPG